MASQKVRRVIWDGLFAADVRARYFSALAARLRSRERVLAVAVGILTSGSVGSLLAKIPHVPLACSVLAAILSTILAVYKFDKGRSLGASLGRQWIEISSEYAALWATADKLSEQSLMKRHRELEQKHFSSDELAMAEFALDEKLLDRCFQKTAESLGAAA